METSNLEVLERCVSSTFQMGSKKKGAQIIDYSDNSDLNLNQVWLRQTFFIKNYWNRKKLKNQKINNFKLYI